MLEINFIRVHLNPEQLLLFVNGIFKYFFSVKKILNTQNLHACVPCIIIYVQNAYLPTFAGFFIYFYFLILLIPLFLINCGWKITVNTFTNTFH